MVNNYFYNNFYNIYYVFLCQQKNITYCITYWAEADLGLLQHLRWNAVYYRYKELYLRCCTSPRSTSVDSALN